MSRRSTPHVRTPEAVTAALPRGTPALARSVRSLAEIAARLPLGTLPREAVARRFRTRIPQYYLDLVQGVDDPIGRQCIPDPAELDAEPIPRDPFAEDDPRYAPTPHLTHRYPDRALLLVTDTCPMYCRFCMRKRKTLEGARIGQEAVERGIAYVRRTPAVREVILSGGDPLVLPDARLAAILERLRAIPHVEVLRIHSRMPCVEPARITRALAETLARFRPVFLVVHFNHPREVTPQAAEALATLAGAGLPLNSQTVLLRGINDQPRVLAELFRRLLRCGVQPYYLHHPDLIGGTAHFRLPVSEGRAIVRRLRARAPELTMLQYVLDTPGGGGKVPLEGPLPIPDFSG